MRRQMPHGSGIVYRPGTSISGMTFEGVADSGVRAGFHLGDDLLAFFDQRAS